MPFGHSSIWQYMDVHMCCACVTLVFPMLFVMWDKTLAPCLLSSGGGQTLKRIFLGVIMY